MSGFGDYLVGYQRGKWAAESAQNTQRMVDLLWGRRPVEVDQSYIDGLHAALQQEQATARHNYKVAEQFERDAENWKAYAQRLEAERDALTVTGERMLATLREADEDLVSARKDASARYAQESRRHDETAAKRDSLERFHYIMATLFAAERAGKSGSPEYEELKLLAQEVSAIISARKNFEGFVGDKLERYQFLHKALSA
jgi:hypothetical protein